MKPTTVTLAAALAILGIAMPMQSHAAGAKKIQVSVTCMAPDPGKYWYGWGSSETVVQNDGKVIHNFRGKTYDMTGTFCKAADNSGMVQFENGEVSVYVRKVE